MPKQQIQKVYPQPKLSLTTDRKRGSATMEYVIVSTFAALLSVAAITFVGRLVKTKVSVMAGKLGMEATEFDFDLGLDQ